MQTSHEMNEKGMESSIPSKLSTPVGRHCNNYQVDFITLHNCQGGFHPALWQYYGSLIGTKDKEQRRIGWRSSKSKFQGKEMKTGHSMDGYHIWHITKQPQTPDHHASLVHISKGHHQWLTSVDK